MASSTPTTRRRVIYWAIPPVILAFSIAWIIVPIFKENHDRILRYREITREVRQQYPLESLESRLLFRSPVTQVQRLSPTAENQLRDFEAAISNEIESTGREAKLRKLHEGTVEEFVRKEGFGVARMVGGYAESVLANGYQKDDGGWVGRNKTSFPQASFALSPSWTEADLPTNPTLTDSPPFLSLHLSNTLHFVHPNGFGMMKDRRNVAGFQPHQFNAIHEEMPWKVLRLELVGLLLGDHPRVYETPMLPRMQDIREAPARSLDAFEAAGLEKLRGGDHLFIRNVPDGVRMVGAIRSAQQCIKCHGGERGALLGAFSYALQRE